MLYKYWGKNSDAGNNLIMDEIHHNRAAAFRRGWRPLVLIDYAHHASVRGDLPAAKAPRCRSGGSLANFFARLLRLSPEDTSMLLTTGIAAGFGAVFGTPRLGAIFALEVLTLGKDPVQCANTLPDRQRSSADIVCSAWGIHQYSVSYLFPSNSRHTGDNADRLVIVLVKK